MTGSEGTSWGTVWAGLWAFGGAIMRGNTDWVGGNGRVQWWKVAAAIVTALVLGQIASALCEAGYVAEPLKGALAGVLGYLGPAFTISLLERITGQGHQGTVDMSKGAENDDLKPAK